MNIGKFEYHIDENMQELDIILDSESMFSKPDREAFYLGLNVDKILQFEFIIDEAKRKLGL